MLKTWGIAGAVLILVVRAAPAQTADGATPKLLADSLAGRDSFEITAIQPNARVDAARFARPAPPVTPAQ